MLQIIVPATEQWDEIKQEFVYTKEITLQLEHSLVSLSKWESKWCKPFLSKEDMTAEETIDYIRCMTITQNVNPEVYTCLSDENIAQVRDYIQAPMTATFFRKENGPPSREIITSDIIYYWMITLQIPSEFQEWHLNRLIALIRVCDIKNSPPKKKSQREIMEEYSRINAERRKQMNTKG